MQYDRAKEIINSPKTFHVLYNGTPVWIENLNNNNQTADVIIKNTSERINVPVNKLEEIKTNN